MTDMYKVNLSGIKTSPPNKNPKVDTIQIGDYEIKTTLPECLTISKIEQDGGEDMIIDISSDDVLIHGKSINAIWKTLENHYEALKALLKHE